MKIKQNNSLISVIEPEFSGLSASIFSKSGNEMTLYEKKTKIAGRRKIIDKYDFTFPPSIISRQIAAQEIVKPLNLYK